MKIIFKLIIFFQFSFASAQSENPASIIQGLNNIKPKLIQEMELVNHQKLIKNPEANEVNVDGIIIDKRAVKYYYKGELEGVTKTKAQKINLIYLNSFVFADDNKIVSEDCKNKFQNEKDLGSYNILRKFNERVEVAVEFEECKFSIYLFSWMEIDNIINK